MIAVINDYLWTYFLVGALIVASLYFTIASGLFQFRRFYRASAIFPQTSRQQSAQKERTSSLQALLLSIAGRVGTGNIAGVAVAMTLGGAGAIFWMWVVALLGMATTVLECSLAQLFKEHRGDGVFRGGPAFYILRGIGSRKLAVAFSICLLFTFGLCFTALQSHTMAGSLEEAFEIPKVGTAIALLAICAYIVFGGTRRIVQMCEIVVPIMSVGYFVVAAYVVAANLAELPAMIAQILRSAVGIDQVVGGGLGATILIGVKRGLFSNEAGLGSGPNVAALADVRHPIDQGVVQSISVFVDTIVLCSCTAVIILLSDVYASDVARDGVALTQIALVEHVGWWGRPFVSVMMVLAAFCSIIYNYFLAENSAAFVFGSIEVPRPFVRIAFLASLVIGALQDFSTVLTIADLTMGILAIINLTALVMLARVGLRLIADYDSQIAAGVDSPALDGAKFADLNIDPRCWPAITESKPKECAPDAAAEEPQPA